MTDFESRLRDPLEQILIMPDPRERISAYHDMPYAIFWYPPDAEFALRASVARLRTRLENGGKRVTSISLAECLRAAMTAQRPLEEWFAAERDTGVEATVQTISNLLEDYQPLVDLVAARMPEGGDPTKDIVLITAVRSITKQIQLLIVYHIYGTVGQLENHRFYRNLFEYCHRKHLHQCVE
jgi:hypothetical protein